MHLNIFILVILFAANYFFSEISLAKEEKNRKIEVVEADLIDVIKNPEKYDGKEVITKGCFVNEFERVVIFVYIKNCVSLPPNGLWVVVPRGSALDSKYFGDKKYKVTISGKVNSKNKGHMNAWSGALENVNISSSEEIPLEK